MKAASNAAAIHLACQTAQSWKSLVYIDDKGIHRPTAFFPLPEKMLGFAWATGQVIQADAGSIEEQFLDTDYFLKHRPTSLLVIPGKERNAVYIENFNTISDIKALTRMAQQVLARFGPDPGITVPRAFVQPINGQHSKKQCKILQAHMADHKSFQNQSLSLESLAKEVGMPRRDVTQAINSCLGQNFHTFVNTYRVEAVKQALGHPANSDRNILDIAYSQGFSSKSAFNNAFKKMVKTTPSSFRAGLEK